MASRLFVSNKDESVRMFNNFVMDKLSRVHFAVPLFIYVPLIGYFLYRALIQNSLAIDVVALWAVVGAVAWSLTEYVLHRFVFHYEPSSELGKKIHFMTHGVHHDYPNDSYRLVMVPAISLPLAVFFYTSFYYILGAVNVDPFFVGFVAGYLVYDMSHYAFHHANWKNPIFQALKKHHMVHHYKEPDRGFGVSSTLWDIIFRTGYRKGKGEF